jgi:hypothetical protein
MKKRYFAVFLMTFPFLFLGCAATTPPLRNSPVISLKKANLKAVLEEQEGLEITWEDAKDLRDFYRGGVQRKAMAEAELREKNYAKALNFYDSSDEFLRFVLGHDDQDSAEYFLFGETSILFFPNLLMADNDLKTGQILWEMGRESAAHHKWMQARHFLHKSLLSEPTEWGLSLQRELAALLASPR